MKDINAPRPFMAKHVDFLHCEPCGDSHPEGRRVTTLTFACEGEIEMPLAFSVPDAKRLALSLLRSLEADGGAVNILERDFSYPEKGVDDCIKLHADGSGVAAEADNLSAPMLRIRRGKRNSSVESYRVLGAYGGVPTGRTVVVCNVGKLGRVNYTIDLLSDTVRPCRRTELLRGQWDKFQTLPDWGAIFIGPRRWRKLDLRSIRQLVGNKIFKLTLRM